MAEKAQDIETPQPVIHVAPAPHLPGGLKTRWMMLDVLIGLLPVTGMAVYVFGWYALFQVSVCVASCVVAEAVFADWRRLGDYSAAVTGLILGLSLPWSAPWYVGVVAGSNQKLSLP